MNDLESPKTVIVVTTSGESAQRTVERLTDSGFSVVGPVERANMALALAAQTPVDLAIADTRLGGRRDGATFARDLMSAWGAPTILVGEDLSAANQPDTAADAWRACCAVSDRVRAILAGEEPAPSASSAA